MTGSYKHMTAEVSRPLVIAGSGRSGTTWVLDVLAAAANLRTVFEPLHPVIGDVAREFANRYVEPDAQEPRLSDFMSRVLAGEFRSLWSDYRVLPDRLLPSARTLLSPRQAMVLFRRYRGLWANIRQYRNKQPAGIAVKFIRANLMLEWLSRNYDVTILFVVRHPCAAIESKLRLDATAQKVGLPQGKGGADWDPYPLLNRYMSDSGLGRCFLDAYRSRIDRHALSPIQAHALIWCIENAPVLHRMSDIGGHLVHYEHLVTGGGAAWLRLFNELGFDGSLTESSLNRPSQQASQDFCASDSQQAKIRKWAGRLSDADKHAIDELLGIFDIDAYSAFDVMPRIPGVDADSRRPKTTNVP